VRMPESSPTPADPPEWVVFEHSLFTCASQTSCIQRMETATFQFTDSRTTIEASLACPRCLHAVAWEPVGAGAQPAVECRCTQCGDARVVELTGAQMLRLTIDDGDDEDDAWVADRPGGATWRQVLQLL
jgi:hypothetical protein